VAVMDAVIYFGILGIGIVLGVLVRRQGELLGAADRLSMGAVYLLVFLLGISAGASEEITRHLGRIGFQALVISLAAMIGSGVVSYAVYVVWFRNLEHEE